LPKLKRTKFSTSLLTKTEIKTIIMTTDLASIIKLHKTMKKIMFLIEM
jgi:hypothetical protein